MQKKRSLRIEDVVLISVFLVLMLFTLYPFWHCLIGSLMSYNEYMQKTILLWPEKVTFASYEFILRQGRILSPLKITTIITVIGTFCTLFMTTWMAYGLSKKFPGSNLITMIVVFTMFINPGMIPYYLLFRKLSLLNSLAVYIVPSLINTFYLIITRTHFSTFSQELADAARIDGTGEYGLFFRIVLPLSIPTLATIGLFTAINYWNTYETSVYYVSNYDFKTLQDYLYMMISSTGSNSQGGSSVIGTSGNATVFSENIKLANTVIVIIPIILIYPFAQKYFTSGMMLGAVKG